MGTTTGRRSAVALMAALALLGSITCSSSSDSPTSPPPAGATMVGIIGCSQTSNAWRGWLDIGDNAVWKLVVGYGGGDISEWSRTIPTGDYWARLDSNVDGNPPATAIWWQICDIVRRPGSFGDAEAVLTEIERRVPGATVYVSSFWRTSKSPRPARSRTSTTRERWPISSPTPAARGRDRCCRWCSTPGSRGPGATAPATSARRASRPSVWRWRRSTGTSAPELAPLPA